MQALSQTIRSGTQNEDWQQVLYCLTNSLAALLEKNNAKQWNKTEYLLAIFLSLVNDLSETSLSHKKLVEMIKTVWEASKEDKVINPLT